MTTECLKIFFCYAHKDQQHLLQLKNHLSLLSRRNNIWYDAEVSSGVEWEREIQKQLDNAQVILLLVSPDFMASNYCFDKEMIRAVERHDRGEATVIPIILRPFYGWQEAPFGKLQALPKGGRPITDWSNRDKAFADVARGIHKAIEERILKGSAGSS